jgi:EAL domain-containing protein (putative c-di-GMP-specific phosphodiesterase class I)
MKLSQTWLLLALLSGLALGAIATIQIVSSTDMRQLLGQGVKMAIDDFGTGYSSLAYLRKLNAHRLKIDRSFIADIADDAEAAAIVSSMIAMARALNLKVTAEGVETGAQAECLTALGCDSVQGFHFASPMSGYEILARYRFTDPASAPGRTV